MKIPSVSWQRSEVFAVVAMAFCGLVRWWQYFTFWPDSTNYLVAATNLVRHHALFVWTNWPSANLQPAIEPFADYLPGYPIYLAAFVAVFRDPAWAAIIGQSLIYAAFIALVYRITVKLGFSGLVRCACVLFFVFFRGYDLFWQSLLSEPIFILLSLAVFLQSLRLLRPDASRKDWALALLLVFLAGSTRWNGFCVGALLLWPIARSRPLSRLCLRWLAATVAVVLPNTLWYLRNSVKIGDGNATHSFQHLLHDRLQTPFDSLTLRWGYGHSLMAIAIFLIPILVPLLSRFRRKMNMPAYAQLWVGCLIQFLTIYLISLFVPTLTPIDDRFLSPAYAFFTLLLFYAIHALLPLNPAHWRIPIWALVLVAVFLGHQTIRKLHHKSFAKLFSVNMPEERALWDALHQKPYFAAADHFLTEDNFVHQIFAGIPHRIVWNSTVDNTPDQIPTYWKIGKNPFFVVREDHKLAQLFRERFLPADPAIHTDQVGRFLVFYK